MATISQKRTASAARQHRKKTKHAKQSAPITQPAAPQSDPTPQEINALGILFSLGRFTETATLAQSMTERFPRYQFGWKILGAVFKRMGKNADALIPMQHAAALSPNDAEAHNNLGATLNDLGRLNGAEACYRQALELNPAYAEAHYNLGNTLKNLGRIDECVASYRQAIQLKPNYAKARNNLGIALMELGQPNEAETNFKMALEFDPACIEALVSLGNLYMEKGQMEKASGLYLRGLNIQPGNLELRYSLAISSKTRKGDANFAALLDIAEKMRNNAIVLSDNEKILLHLTLGRCYEDCNDYEQAFPHFLEGCKLKRSTLHYDANRAAQQFTEIGEIFNNSTINRLRGAGHASDLPIFILGMPRSGTTLIEQIIASHPDVYGAGELPDLMRIAKQNITNSAIRMEFPGNLRSLDQATLNAWGAQYVAGLKQRAFNARRITDKMPENFFAVGLIHLMLPNAKIIHVKRNPIDTCLSCFTQLFNGAHEYAYDLAELGQYYVEYSLLMEHWRKVLPAGALLDVNYEDLVTQPESQTRRMLEFCGLEWNNACMAFHKSKRSIRTASTVQVRQPIYQSSVERWRHYYKFLGPLLDNLGYLAPKDKH